MAVSSTYSPEVAPDQLHAERGQDEQMLKKKKNDEHCYMEWKLTTII